MVYDSLGPTFSSLENVKERISFHVKELQLFFDELFREKGLPQKPWSEVQIC
jgi:hypothetical protein